MPIPDIQLLLWILVFLHIALTWALAIRRGWRARQGDAQQPQPPLEDLPPVSVIVPAWNEKGTIEPCMSALQKIDYPDWEAIILAGGLDGTYQAALQAAAGDNRFRVLERGAEPKNIALMRGVQVARHEILVLLDADSVVFPSWLSALIEPLENGASVTFGERLPLRETWVTLAEQMQNIQTYHILGNTSIQGDRSLALRRNVFERIGLLPAHAYAREDWDLGVRLVNAGECITFARAAKLLTDRPATLHEFWINEVRWRRTHLAGLWEHRVFGARHPLWAIYQFYFYGLSALLSLALIAGLVAAMLWPPVRLGIVAAITLTVLWLGGRRTALGTEVSAYTGEMVWLWRVWAPVVLMFVAFPASVIAMLSVNRGTPYDYKGPRVLGTS